MNLADEKWTWAECGTDNAVVYVDDDCTVGGVYHGSDTDLLSHERARLIAAAPDLLKAAGNLLWLANNAHNVKADPDRFVEFLKAAAADARKAYDAATGAN